jgi:hypothetical protein
MRKILPLVLISSLFTADKCRKEKNPVDQLRATCEIKNVLGFLLNG